jgi:hypothetical protein
MSAGDTPPGTSVYFGRKGGGGVCIEIEYAY